MEFISGDYLKIVSTKQSRPESMFDSQGREFKAVGVWQYGVCFDWKAKFKLTTM